MTIKILKIINKSMKSVKIVAIGDGSVGKTCLLVTYTKNQFPEEYVPTVYENYSEMINIENETIRLEIWDTAGQEEYSNLRPASYPNTDVFLVCFSLISPDSLEDIERVWIPDVNQYCSTASLILVGLKSDLRDNFDSQKDDNEGMNFRPIEKDEIDAVKNRIGATEYIECSSLLKYNIKEVFETASKIAIHKTSGPLKPKNCYLI